MNFFDIQFAIVGFIAVCYFIIDTIFMIKENKKTNNKLNNKNIRQLAITNYEQDFKLLNDMVDTTINTIGISELREYIEGSYTINDKIYESLIEKLTIEILNDLSEPYKNLINVYISDVDLYVYKQVRFNILNIVMKVNEKNINQPKRNKSIRYA